MPGQRLASKRRGCVDQRHAGIVVVAAGNILDVHVSPISLVSLRYYSFSRRIRYRSAAPFRAPDIITIAAAGAAQRKVILMAKRSSKTASSSTKAQPSAAASDDTTITALKLPPAPLAPDMAAYFAKCEEKLGFVPNVLKAYAFDMAEAIRLCRHV